MNKKKFELLSINKKQKLNFSYKKKIIVRDLLLNIVIGYYRSEKIKKQNVKFNIELDYTDQKNHNDKDIKSIITFIKNHWNKTHIFSKDKKLLDWLHFNKKWSKRESCNQRGGGCIPKFSEFFAGYV